MKRLAECVLACLPVLQVGQLPSPRHASDELIEGVEYSAEVHTYVCIFCTL